jgi:hypothetical protein
MSSARTARSRLAASLGGHAPCLPLEQVAEPPSSSRLEVFEPSACTFRAHDPENCQGRSRTAECCLCRSGVVRQAGRTSPTPRGTLLRHLGAPSLAEGAGRRSSADLRRHGDRVLPGLPAAVRIPADWCGLTRSCGLDADEDGLQRGHDRGSVPARDRTLGRDRWHPLSPGRRRTQGSRARSPACCRRSRSTPMTASRQFAEGRHRCARASSHRAAATAARSFRPSDRGDGGLDRAWSSP